MQLEGLAQSGIGYAAIVWAKVGVNRNSIRKAGAEKIDRLQLKLLEPSLAYQSHQNRQQCEQAGEPACEMRRSEEG